MIRSLIRYTNVLSVVGDILTIKADGASYTANWHWLRTVLGKSHLRK
jgi:hypothetical protein